MPDFDFQIQITKLKDQMFPDVKEKVPVPDKNYHKVGTVNSLEELVKTLTTWIEDECFGTEKKETETTAQELIEEMEDITVCPDCGCPNLEVHVRQWSYFTVVMPKFRLSNYLNIIFNYFPILCNFFNTPIFEKFDD